jgi:hypothetical protein
MYREIIRPNSQIRPPCKFTPFLEIIMRTIQVAAAVALLSLLAAPAFAQSFGEPSAFAAQHPDRDVLNGGALTPAARAAPGLGEPRSAYAAAPPSAAFDPYAPPVRAPYAHRQRRQR